MDKDLSMVGVAWFLREDWEALQALFPDRDEQHDSYDAWRADAQKLERELRDQGRILQRVIVRPAAFAAWCAARGREPNADARTDYTLQAMAERYKRR